MYITNSVRARFTRNYVTTNAGLTNVTITFVNELTRAI